MVSFKTSVAVAYLLHSVFAFEMFKEYDCQNASFSSFVFGNYGGTYSGEYDPLSEPDSYPDPDPNPDPDSKPDPDPFSDPDLLRI